jgi:hypothetical protein
LGVSGNITAANITANTGVFTGNGAGLSQLAGANVTGTVANATFATSAGTAGTVTTAAQPNITSVGTLTGLGVNGTITGVNITANTGVFTGNGAALTNLNASNISSGTLNQDRLANSNVILGSTTLALGTTTTTVDGLSSVTSTTFVGALTGAATTAGTVTTNAQPNITSTGTLTSLAVTGNVTAGNVYANSGTIGASLLTGTLTTAAQPNITSVGTLTSLGVNGTVTGVAFTANTGIFTGNGSGLTSLTGANVTGTVSAATTAGTVTTAAQPNITSVGTLTSLGISGALTTTQITAGANTTAGNITGNWTLTAGSKLEATYADLAEYYEADEKYEPGTVLMFGGEKEVTLADDGTSRVAGVVSTNPAYVMNATCPGLLTAVALQGRVPCKVRGNISKGDMLISGGNGFARPNQFPSMGTVIGKALEDFDGYEGVIEVAVGRL